MTCGHELARRKFSEKYNWNWCPECVKFQKKCLFCMGNGSGPTSFSLRKGKMYYEREYFSRWVKW